MRGLLVLSLLAAGLHAQSITVLTEDQIHQLETTVSQSPDDRQSQTLLGQNYAFQILGITELGKYNTVTAVDPARAASPFAQYCRDAIANSTLPAVEGEGGEALWNFTFQVEGYAGANRLTIPQVDGRPLGVQALERAITLEPDQARWRSYHIPIVILRSQFNNILPLSVADAYTLVSQDMAVLTGMDRDFQLAPAAKLAVRAGALDDARGFARELLDHATDPQDWNYGNAIFFGNMVLGQVAIRENDLDSAKSYLQASGATPGSPQLDSFGPNMSLAKDLLDAGERDSVLAFFDQCRVFWKLDFGRLDLWTGQVKAGVVPDFGANLLY